MPHQANALLFEIIKHRIELRIINHDQLAVLVPKLHANVLPNLDGNGAISKSGLQVLDRFFNPIHIIPPFKRKR